MKTLLPSLLILLALPSFGQSPPYWSCYPQQGKDEPKILVFQSKRPGMSVLVLQKDLVRSEGTVPKGRYEGSFSPSTSGFSYFARFDMEKYFPKITTDGNGAWLTFILSKKSSLFLSETYLLWKSARGTEEGILVNEYGCKAHRAKILR